MTSSEFERMAVPDRRSLRRGVPVWFVLSKGATPSAGVIDGLTKRDFHVRHAERRGNLFSLGITKLRHRPVPAPGPHASPLYDGLNKLAAADARRQQHQAPIAGAVNDVVHVRAGQHHVNHVTAVELRFEAAPIMGVPANSSMTVVISLPAAFALRRQLDEWGVRDPEPIK